jgi:predicted dehydrogenase
MLTIHQEDAYIELDFTTQDISIHRHASSSVKVSTGEVKYRQEGTVERLFVYKENPLKSELEHFVDAIRTGHNRRQEHQDLLALQLTLDLAEKVLRA